MGLKPITYRLEFCYSIQLSYGALSVGLSGFKPEIGEPKSPVLITTL